MSGLSLSTSSSSTLQGCPIDQQQHVGAWGSTKQQEQQHCDNKQRKKSMTPPTLASLCMGVIASKIERYPPEALGVLSELEWESVVKLRHVKTSPGRQQQQQQLQLQSAGTFSGPCSSPPNKNAKPGNPGKSGKNNNNNNNSGGLDGTGRMAPAISDKVMRSIEDANPHLRSSVVADRLIWKDCVNYKFKMNGPSRPRSLLMPYPVFVEKLQKSGTDLLKLLKAPPSFDGEVEIRTCDGGEEEEKTNLEKIKVRRMKVLEASMQFMKESPMNVSLLTASGVGKAVTKFLKSCSKMNNGNDVPSYMVDVWTARSQQRMLPSSTLSSVSTLGSDAPPCARLNSSSPLQQLENLLQGWKTVASAQGVQVSKKSEGGGEDLDCSGRDKRTTKEQHARDMKILEEKCHSWRDLHAALMDREAKTMANHGARMRQIRENIEHDKHKVRKITLKATKKAERQEAILSGSRGIRAMTSTGASSSSSTGGNSGLSKLQVLKKESAVAASWQKASVNKLSKKPGTSSFGAAIANAHAATGRLRNGMAVTGVASATAGGVKRKALEISRSGQVALGGGKLMKLPKKTPNSANGVFAAINRKQQQKQQQQQQQAKGKSKAITKGGNSFRR